MGFSSMGQELLKVDFETWFDRIEAANHLGMRGLQVNSWKTAAEEIQDDFHVADRYDTVLE